MSYWQYIAKTTGIKFAGVVLAVFAIFYLAGLWMPEIKSWIEFKYLIPIIGIPVSMFFGINYYIWRRDHKK